MLCRLSQLCRLCVSVSVLYMPDVHMVFSYKHNMMQLFIAKRIITSKNRISKLGTPHYFGSLFYWRSSTSYGMAYIIGNHYSSTVSEAQTELNLWNKRTYIVDTAYMNHCSVCMHCLLSHHSIRLQMQSDRSHSHRLYPGSM